MRRLLLQPTRNDQTIDEHNAILAALDGHNPEQAARAMHVHLGNVLTDLRKFAAQRPELFEPCRTR